MKRWNKEQVNEWYVKHSWLVRMPFLALFIFPLFASTGMAASNPKIAILYDTQDEGLAAVVNLAEVALVNKGKLEVLERGEIDLILSEQALAVSGLAKFEDYLRVNKILKADILFVIQNSGTPAVPQWDLVGFDTTRGLRLVDTYLESISLEESVKQLTEHVQAARVKLEHAGDDLQSICVQSVRNVELDTKFDRSIYLLGDLLAREFTALPDIALLERSFLGRLQDEKDLAGVEADGLLASSSFLTIEFLRGRNPGTIKLSGHLRGRHNGPIHHFTHEAAQVDAVAFAGKILNEVLRHMGYEAGPAGGGTEAEAGRFYREARFFSSQFEYRRCLTAAEAASVLAPENSTYRTYLAERYITTAGYFTGIDRHDHLTKDGRRKHSTSSSMRGIYHSADTNKVVQAYGNYLKGVEIMCSQILSGQAGERSDDAFEQSLNQLQRATSQADAMFKRIADPYIPERAKEHRKQIKAHLYNVLVVERNNRKWAMVTDEESFRAYTAWMVRELLPSMQAAVSSSHDWSMQASTLVGQWLDRLDDAGISGMLTEWSDMGRLLLAPEKYYWHMERKSLGYMNKAPWKLASRDVLLWEGVYSRLQAFQNPVLKYYGDAGFFRIRHWAREYDEQTVDREQDALWNAGLGMLASIPSEQPRSRYHAYHALLNAAMLFRTRDVIPYYNDLREYMMTSREFVYGVAWRSSCWRPIWDRRSNEERLESLESMLSYMEQPTLACLHPPECSSDMREVILAKHYQIASKLNRKAKPPQFTEVVGSRPERVFEKTSYLSHLDRPRNNILLSEPLVLVYGHLSTLAGAGMPTNGLERVTRFKETPHLFLDLMHVSMKEKRSRLIKRIAVDHVGVEDLKVYGSKVMLLLYGTGILSYSLDDDSFFANSIDMLPTKMIHRMARVDHHVMLARGRGELFLLDLDTGQWEAVVSNRRIEKKNPLDEISDGVFTPYIWASAERKAFYFFVLNQAGSGRELAGIWRYQLETGALVRIGNLTANAIEAIQLEEKGGLWIRGMLSEQGEDVLGILRWDPASEKAVVVVKHKAENRQKGSALRRMPKGAFKLPHPPYVMHNGYLWTGEPLGRIDLATGRFEGFSINGRFSSVLHFMSFDGGIRALIRENQGDLYTYDILDNQEALIQ